MIPPEVRYFLNYATSVIGYLVSGSLKKREIGD
jgi:hypothetical protein